MRKNREQTLIDGLALIANLKDELEDYHYFSKQIKMIVVAEKADNLSCVLANENDDLRLLTNYVYELKKESWKLKEKIEKLKGGTDELQ